MTIQLTWSNPGSGVGGYRNCILGDGVSTSVTIDLFQQIASDDEIKNKNPIGIYLVTVDRGITPSVALVGTLVTLTWATAPALDIPVNIGMYPIFNP